MAISSLLRCFFSEEGQNIIDPFDQIKSMDNKKKEDFHWVDTELYHRARRKKILTAHPEIENLYGTEINTFTLTVFVSTLMVLFSIWIRDKPLYLFFAVGYVFGGTLTHWLQLSGHESSHDLVFKTTIYNKLLAIFANLPTGIPSAISFRRYHLEHHAFQSVDQLDQDIPTFSEGKIFQSSFFKLLWIIFLPFFYSLRPCICRPKVPGMWEILNFSVVILFDATLVHFFGIKSLLFLVYSTLIGMGLHPVAGNFIAEHFEFVYNWETYSYYGPMNVFNLNVGYHNEHHDFPRVPWTRLPLVHRAAKEFYCDLPCYSSYLKIMYYYVTCSEIGPFSRIKRKKEIPREKNN